MKSFFQRKSAAPYYKGRSYTIAIRKDYVELYHNIGEKWHSVINLEIYKDGVRMIVRLGASFTQDLFEKVMTKGLDVEKYPLLTELISPDSPYKIVVDRTGKDDETRMVRDVDGEHPNFLLALGDPKVLEAANDIRDYFIDLHYELLQSPDPDIVALTNHFYD